MPILNDTHSRLNPTRVQRVLRPTSREELRQAIVDSPHLSLAGSRHAMGGQQFATDATCIDTRGLDRILAFDHAKGLVRAEAGIEWPALIRGIREFDQDGTPRWGIRQKQTGASDLTLGGALAANIHGRGLRMAPFVSDIEAFTIITADGDTLECSRTSNPELFSLAIGGYGLFGAISDATLRLSPRAKVRRDVDVIQTTDIMQQFDDEATAGALYGDFQFTIDHESDDFLRRGVYSRYLPVDPQTPIPHDQRYFTEDLWFELLRLARTDRARAFERYAEYYGSTSGQIYETDTHQLSTYVPRYHDRLTDLPQEAQGSEVISELYVPRDRLVDFLEVSAEIIRSCNARLTYGTTRLIERDTETFLPWARQDFACVIFNLLTPNTSPGVEKTAKTFRCLIDAALQRDGSFFLTYHRYATPDQVEAAYPEIREFLKRKHQFDPNGRFQSDWFRHLDGAFCAAPRNSLPA